MPRDGSGIYSTLAGTDGIPDRTIESARYNANVHDVEADLNAPRPIVAGGTGATNARDAMLALGGEFANQAVSNYDTFPFLSGSFWSSPGATGAPNGTDFFVGMAYANVPTIDDMYLEARSFATDIKYVRRRGAGGWGAWSRENADIIALADSKVAKAGDTMTGPLQINNTLTATGAVAVGGDLLVDGNWIKFNPSTVTLNYNTGLGRLVLAGAHLQVNQDIVVTGTTPSTSITTGSLTVAGGAGIGGAVNAGGGCHFGGPVLTSTGNNRHSFYYDTSASNGVEIMGTVNSVNGPNLAAFYNNGNATWLGAISIVGAAPGTGVAYNTTSDIRLKDDFRPFMLAGDIIDRLRVWEFCWRATGERGIGVVAQEAVEVFPDAISVPRDDVTPYGVDNSRFVPLLIAEIQSLRRRIEALETRP